MTTAPGSPRALRVAWISAVTALLCFLFGGFFLSPLSHGVANETQDQLGLYGFLGWFASHLVGAPASVMAWRSARSRGATVATAVLAVAHVALLFVAGALTGLVLLLSGARIH